MARTSIGDLSNKIALITGASSGLGRAIAFAYAAAGAYIVNADLKPEPHPAASEISSIKKEWDVIRNRNREGGKEAEVGSDEATVDGINRVFGEKGKERALFVKCDVTVAEDVENAVRVTVEKFGRLDIMVNNAGVSLERLGQRIHETDISRLDKTLAINVRGTFLGCKYAITQMLEKQSPHEPSGDRGWIINMCSIYGLVGSPGAASYCASKGAVMNMTRSIALEYATDHIHINCINPGFADTNLVEQLRQAGGAGGADAVDGMIAQLHPWGRLAHPEEVAKMAVFLAGDGASFITGQAFVVDGGYTAQ